MSLAIQPQVLMISEQQHASFSSTNAYQMLRKAFWTAEHIIIMGMQASIMHENQGGCAGLDTLVSQGHSCTAKTMIRPSYWPLDQRLEQHI